MKAEDVLFSGFLLFMAGCTLVFGFGIGTCKQRQISDTQWRQDMVKRGYGQMVIIDTLTGTTEFQWRKP